MHRLVGSLYHLLLFLRKLLQILYSSKNQKEFHFSLTNSSFINNNYFYLQLGSFMIRNHPIIGHIPPNRSKLFSFINDSMKISQRIKQFLKLIRILAVFLLSDSFINIKQIGFQSLGIFSGNLDPILENTNRKLGTRHTGQPEPISRING